LGFFAYICTLILNDSSARGKISTSNLTNIETMIGTIVNASTIIAGSIIGSLLHRGVKEKYKEVLYTGL